MMELKGINELAHDEQLRIHALGRNAEEIARQYLGGELTTHKAPFDLIDWTHGIAYEIKGMLATRKELRMEMAKSSYNKKIAFSRANKLRRVLVFVIIYPDGDVELRAGTLKRTVRVHQLKQLKAKDEPAIKPEFLKNIRIRKIAYI